jgi:hypothetical protein
MVFTSTSVVGVGEIIFSVIPKSSGLDREGAVERTRGDRVFLHYTGLMIKSK